MDKNDSFGGGINVPLYSVISSFELNGKNILSLGCGSAALEEKLEKEYNCKVTGLDYDKNAIELAKKKISKAFTFNLEKDSLNTVLKKDKFNIVILADILEHLRNPEKVLTEIKEFLSKDGLIITSIPNIANWSVRLKLLFGEFNYTSHGLLDKTHLKFYTLKNAKRLICNNNYKIEKIYYSTSLVNIIYKKIKREHISKDNYQNTVKLQKNKSLLKSTLKKSVEYFDRFVTNIFPGLFAYQFIIVVKQNN